MNPYAGSNLTGIFDKDGIRAALINLDKLFKGMQFTDVESVQISRFVNENLSIDSNGIVTIAGIGDNIRITDDGALQFSPDDGETWATIASSAELALLSGDLQTLDTTMAAHINNSSIHGGGGTSTPAVKRYMRNTRIAPPNNWIAGNDFASPENFIGTEFSILALIAKNRHNETESIYRRIAPNDGNRVLMDFGIDANSNVYFKWWDGATERTFVSQNQIPYVLYTPFEVGVLVCVTLQTIAFTINGIVEPAQSIGAEAWPLEVASERYFIGNGFVGDFYALAITNDRSFPANSAHIAWHGGLAAVPNAVIAYQADHVPTNPANLQDLVALIRGTTPAYHLYRIADQEPEFSWRL